MTVIPALCQPGFPTRFRVNLNLLTVWIFTFGCNSTYIKVSNDLIILFHQAWPLYIFARHLNAIPKIFSCNTNLLVRDLSFFFCCTSSLYCEWEQEWRMEKVQRLMVMYLTEVTLEVKYAGGPLSHFQRLHRIRTNRLLSLFNQDGELQGIVMWTRSSQDI